jgi:hypothetical protein
VAYDDRMYAVMPPHDWGLFTPIEAAVLTGLPIKAEHNAIDKGHSGPVRAAGGAGWGAFWICRR